MVKGSFQHPRLYYLDTESFPPLTSTAGSSSFSFSFSSCLGQVSEPHIWNSRTPVGTESLLRGGSGGPTPNPNTLPSWRGDHPCGHHCLTTRVLPHRGRTWSVGKKRPWLIRTYGFLIQVKMSEPCCIWCHFSLLKMPHKAVTKGEETEKNTVITHSRAGFCGSLPSGLRD